MRRLPARCSAGIQHALSVCYVQPERRALRALCVYWGQLYQIADDLADLGGRGASDKTAGRDRALARPNLALALGSARAEARFHRLARQAARTLATLRARGRGRWDYLWELHAAVARLPAPAAEAAHRAA